jgi:hypothetical protein
MCKNSCVYTYYNEIIHRGMKKARRGLTTPEDCVLIRYTACIHGECDRIGGRLLTNGGTGNGREQD